MLHAALTSSLAADREECDAVLVLLPNDAPPVIMTVRMRVCAFSARRTSASCTSNLGLSPHAARARTSPQHARARTHAACSRAVPRRGRRRARCAWLPRLPRALRLRRRHPGGGRAAGAHVHAAAALPALRAAGAARGLMSESIDPFTMARCGKREPAEALSVQGVTRTRRCSSNSFASSAHIACAARTTICLLVLPQHARPS